ncbi:MAG: molybdenum cofactor guanylyltransferase [Clostridia bacterium]|nr:molybdenum cofactor guanylyltransferase [Clostridia bacterium]
MDAAMIILAGGKNSRMKKEKAFLAVDDQPMIEKTIANAKGYVNEIIVVTNRPEAYQYLDAIVTTDVIPGQGPLSGIHAGLLRTSAPCAFVVACDMPFISMDLARRMWQELDHYDVVVPSMGGGLQPLHAVYSSDCISVIEKYLHQNVKKVTDVYRDLRIKIIDEKQLTLWGIDSWVFFNVNTPDELAIAKSVAEELNMNRG